ncbi:MAG TPA: hypothetical protein VFZ65_16905 [Planctomycetota bacterium]|nr:hypothetical protein [Planctomycetota bacterium]
MWRAVDPVRTFFVVFADHFLPNLLLFVAGQAAAWYYLRTGRFLIGASATAALWLLADWFVLAKFVFGTDPADLLLPLWSLQIVALGTVAALALARWRRRWSRTARQRPALFQAGVAQYLRADYEAASATLRRLVRADPWDAAAWIALGNVFSRQVQPRRARACYRRAAAVDTARAYGDLLEQQGRRVPRDRVSSGPAKAAAAAVANEPRAVPESGG